MMKIELEEQAWRAVLAILARSPWQEVNGLIMAIGEQMQRQAASSQNVPTTVATKGNSADHPADEPRQ